MRDCPSCPPCLFGHPGGEAWIIVGNYLLEWPCHSHCVSGEALFTQRRSQLPPLKLETFRHLSYTSPSSRRLKLNVFALRTKEGNLKAWRNS